MGARRPSAVRDLEDIVLANLKNPYFFSVFGFTVLRVLELMMPCTKCGAEAGGRCVGPSGNELSYVHAVRSRGRMRQIWEQARRQLAEVRCPLCGSGIGPAHELHRCRVRKEETKELPAELIPFLAALKAEYDDSAAMMRDLKEVRARRLREL